MPRPLSAPRPDLSTKSPRKASDNGFIVGIQAVAVQFAEFRERAVQIIQREWSQRMPGDLYPVPRAEVRVNLALRLLDLLRDQSDFLFEGDVDRVSFGMF